MAIKTVYRNEVAIIKVDLRATIHQAANLKQTVEYDIQQNIRDFIIDLSHCEFFDSTFVGVLVVTLKKLKNIGGTLKIIKPKNVFQSMLEAIGGSKIFDMCDTVEEALYQINKSDIIQPKYSNNHSDVNKYAFQ
jgi:anti-anti-sigma factor